MEVQESLNNYILNERLEGEAPEGFDNDYDLIDSGIIDSLFMMSLITYLEQHHEVNFGMNDMVPENFKSVNALSAFVLNQ